MVDIYLFIVILMILLAVSSLIIGVTNDACNFLNSALGSKSAPRKIILLIAGLGIIIGATFSDGMMEIARSGMFHPELFSFSEVMLIYLSIMLANLVLLDTFNTLGLPTSTTVSMVFALLGAAVGMAFIKVSGNSVEGVGNISSYINTSKALAVISGILLSVVIAFTFGFIVQFITRFAFSFDIKKTIKYFGGIFGGVAVTAIFYFIIVKGAEGSSIISDEFLTWLESHLWQMMIYCFLCFAVIFQILIMTVNLNIFRVIVLLGCFSLALAFAGNDLVNFIGVPLAALDSYQTYTALPNADPDSLMMVSLRDISSSSTLMLLLAGIIMTITLFFSKKAQTVSQTEINLARQNEGDERFSSTAISRSLVRGAGEISKFMRSITPRRHRIVVQRRFDHRLHKYNSETQDNSASFDLVRASVNMFLASILIAVGTSLQLPLSTTYVSFMVAMGTSLADGAWGRESAVFRITGVFTVIGGWFFTALGALILAFIIIVFLHWGGTVGIIATIIIALYLLFKNNIDHKKKIKAEEIKKQEISLETESGSSFDIVEKCNSSINDVVNKVPQLYLSSVSFLINEKRKDMKKTLNEVNGINIFAKDLKYNLHSTLKQLEVIHVETGHYYVQVLDYIREIAHCLTYIADPIFEYLDNHHPPLIKDQIKDLDTLSTSIEEFFGHINITIANKDFHNLNELIAKQQSILELINKCLKKQIRYIKTEQVGTRSYMLYANILSETKNLMLHTVNMVKAYRDFIYSELQFFEQ